MFFSSIFTSTLLAATSAATIQHQQHPSSLSARQFNGGTCGFDMEQYKATDESLAYFSGEARDGSGEAVDVFQLHFETDGYPVVVRGYPEFLLVVKEDGNDTAPIQYQYLGQKWKSDDAEKCTQAEYVGESRNISCSFEC